jgi:hypothetical protein
MSLPSEQIKMPAWFWYLLGGAIVWMTSQSVQTTKIQSDVGHIRQEHQRRILKLEDRVDNLTDRMFRVEADQ